jgi:N-acetylglutamate synthase-like GNAT family acetyltransferase
MPLQLRLAQDTDAERLMHLINAAFHKAEGYIIGRDRADLELVRSLLAQGEFLVAEDNARLVGCVYLEHKGERAYLGLLSVSPERQKTGVGSILMRESEQRCVRNGCRFIDLKTLNLRTDNRAFYKRRGYLETGTEPFPPEVKTELPCHFVKMSKPLV